MKITLFIPCLVDQFTPRTAVAMVKILEHLGHELSFPPAQTCCGQPMFNAGHRAEAAILARRMIDLFAGADVVLTPSGSCAAMVREHFAGLFAPGSPRREEADRLAARTWEFIEFLDGHEKLDLRRLGARRSLRVTHHLACHLHQPGRREAAERLLGQIEGLEYVPAERGEDCCGFGGVFALRYPNVSGQMAHEKAANLRATAVDAIVCDEAGCSMNIAGAGRRDGWDAPWLSLAEIIAESLGLLEPEAGP